MFADSTSDADHALNRCFLSLQDLTLEINAAKTCIRRVEEGFRFLGVALGTGVVPSEKSGGEYVRTGRRVREPIPQSAITYRNRDLTSPREGCYAVHFS